MHDKAQGRGGTERAGEMASRYFSLFSDMS